jgi:hypothetical protein
MTGGAAYPCQHAGGNDAAAARKGEAAIPSGCSNLAALHTVMV